MNAQIIIELLGLKPLSKEGGYYRETYRSTEKIPEQVLPARFSTDKHLSTAIYYLLTADSFSSIHRVSSDELFHFYLGDPVMQLLLYPDGHTETRTLGQDIGEGQRLQSLIPGGVWQGGCLVEGGGFALLGTTMAPGFDFHDFELGNRHDLLRKYHVHSSLIERLTHAQKNLSSEINGSE